MSANHAMSAAGSAHRFNRICYALGLLWIACAFAMSLRLWPIETRAKEYHDFSQFYMGGLIARHHAWEALYPIPKPDSPNSPGEADDSDMRPGYAELAAQAGVPANATRFIQPPPFALLMEPIAYLNYRSAKNFWKLLSAIFIWGVAVQAGCIAERCIGRRSKLAGVTALLIAFSPLTVDSLRILNVSPLIAVLIGFSILGLMQKHAEGGALALVVGALSKYATAVLFPLYVIQRRWRAIGLMILATAAIIGGSIAIMGTGPFDVFRHQIMPTFGRVHTEPWNRSLPAVFMMALRMQPPLHGALKWILQIGQWLVLLAILARLFTTASEERRNPSTIAAGAAALMAWFLIFSPIVWDHYFLYLMPVWGWMLYEMRRSWLAVICIVPSLLYQSFSVILDRQLDALQSRSVVAGILISGGMLICAGLILLVAVTRMRRPTSDGDSIELEGTAGNHERPILPDVQQQSRG
jgi:hypothetical protein